MSNTNTNPKYIITPPVDMMTNAPSRVLAREIQDYLKTANAGAWTVGEPWLDAVALVHPFRPQGWVTSLESAKAHIARHA